MPSVPMVNVADGDRSERSLSDAVFGVKPNRHVLYEAVKHYRARRRRGTHATKSRALVRGGGRKPWRQKGTGRARVGSTRNPLWRKGGTAFGPHVRDHGFKLNGKVQRGALRSALSLRVEGGAVTVVSDLEMEKPSTKSLKAKLAELAVAAETEKDGRVLIVDAKPGEALVLSARNLPQVEVRSTVALHAYDVLAARRLVITEAAAARLEEKLSR